MGKRPTDASASRTFRFGVEDVTVGCYGHILDTKVEAVLGLARQPFRAKAITSSA